MSRPRRLALALLSATLLAAPAAAETLTDALIEAYRNSNLIERNRAVLRAADEDVASAVAALRPALAFVAASQYVDNIQTLGLTNSLGLSASLTLFDSGRRSLSREIAQETVLATREALVSVEQGVLLEAVEAYMGVRQALDFVSLNQNSARLLGEELRAVQDRFEVGEVTRTDTAQAEAARATAQAGLQSAQGDLTVARERYRAAVGRFPGTLAAPPTAPAIPATLDEAKGIAQRTHPSIKQAQREVNVAELNVALAAAQRRPQVDLSASLSYDDTYDRDSQAVGVELSQPLYQGGGLSALHRRAIANRDAARSALQQRAIEVAYSVGAAWSQLQVSRANVRALGESVSAAQVAYDGVREEARLGARTTLDVLDAEQELLRSQTDLVAARTRQYVAVYSLLSSMGLLTVDHLKLGIPTYDPSAYYNAVKNAPYTSVQGQKLDRVLRSIGKK